LKLDHPEGAGQFKEKDGGFTGGLQLGWRSDTDETVAGVFVSKAFSFLEFGQ
jgi:hypothetical protein